MAADSTPLLRRRSTLLVKTETTTGTAETLAAADGAINVYNMQWTPDVPTEERQDQASFGRLASIHGTRTATVEFETDLAGTELDLMATTLLPACGFTAAANVLSLAYSAAQPTVTIGCYYDGVKLAIAGAAGSVSFPLRAGFPCRARWRFLGKIVADADVALVVPTAYNTAPPRWAGNNVTFGSYTPRLSSLTIDVNNTLVMREDPADAAGVRACVIVDRLPTVTADPEMSLVATRNWYNMLTNHTEEALSVAIGTAVDNTITIASNNLQWTQIPLGERNGLLTRQVTGQLNQDSLSLTFT